jgi:DNA invertase Pin-like site-specific DNA recombinase
MPDGPRAARYIRLSRTNQSPCIQAEDTGRFIEQRGWQLVDTYSDGSTSGSHARRQGFARLMSDARRRAFDIVVVWRADRAFTGTKSMVTTIDELTALGIGFVSVTEPFDTVAPDGHHFLRLMSAFAELESQILAERTRAGLDEARRQGARLGRPRVQVDIERAVELRASGKSLREAARILNVGAATLHRALKPAPDQAVAGEAPPCPAPPHPRT